MTSLRLQVEIAFQQQPFSGTTTWTDVSTYVETAGTNLGRNYETDHNEASSVSLLVRNDGRFNPLNPLSPYYPYVLPFRPVRLTGYDLSNNPKAVWYGYIQSWPQNWTNQRGYVQLVGVDALKAVFGFIPGDPYDVRIRKDYNVYTGTAASGTAWDLWAFDEASSVGPFASENTGNAHPLTPATGSTGLSLSTPSPVRASLSFAGSAELTPATTSGGFGEFWMYPTALPTTPGTANLVLGAQLPSTGGTTVNAVAMLGLPSDPYLGVLGGTSTSTAIGTAYCGFVKPYQNLMPSDNAADMETSIADWAVISGTPTISRVTGAAAYGNANLRMTVSNGTSSSIAMTTKFPVTVGTSYGLSFPIKNPSAGTWIAFNAAFRWYNSSGTLLSTSTSTNISIFTTWKMASFSNTFTAPANAAFADLLFTGAGSSTPASADIDAIMVWAHNAGLLGGGGLMDGQLTYRPPSAGNPVEFTFMSTASNATQSGFDVYRVSGLAINTWYHVGYATRLGTGNASPLLCVNGIAQTPATVNAFPSGSPTGPAIGAYGLGGVYQLNNTSVAANMAYQGLIACVYLGNWNGSAANSPTAVTAAWCGAHYKYGTTALGVPRQHDYPAELTSQRVLDVCSSVGFPGSMVVVETGLTTMRASGDVTGTPATSLLEAAADAELGNVFINQAGQVSFHNRSHRNSATIVATFGENTSGGEIPYEGDIVTSFDDQYIYNDVQNTQDGVSPSFMWEEQDTTSQLTYGVRTLQNSVQCANASDVTSMAQTLLARYKDPLMRLPSVSIDLRSKPTFFAQVLSLNIGDAVTVKRRPLDAPSFQFNAFLDGISHQIDKGQWKVTFMLTPMYPNTTY